MAGTYQIKRQYSIPETIDEPTATRFVLQEFYRILEPVGGTPQTYIRAEFARGGELTTKVLQEVSDELEDERTRFPSSP